MNVHLANAPLEQGHQLFELVRNQLLAAACSAVHPSQFFRVPKACESYVHGLWRPGGCRGAGVCAEPGLRKSKSASSTDTYDEQTVWVQEDPALPDEIDGSRMIGGGGPHGVRVAGDRVVHGQGRHPFANHRCKRFEFRFSAPREIVRPAGRWPRQWLVGARPAGGRGRLCGANISLPIIAAKGLSVAFPHPAAREIVRPARRWPRQWFVGARPAGGRLRGKSKSERGGLAGCVRRRGRRALPGGAAASAIY
jgi:hypothetical protein